MKTKSPWRPIKTAKKQFLKEIDLWLTVPASPRSMGWGDSFRVPDAYWLDGDYTKEKEGPGWYHIDHCQHKRLKDDYITHWMPIPKPPKKAS